jgi:uncharacterized surface protein with fasciclin (FAS1) repeats
MKTLKLFGALFCAIAILSACEEEVGTTNEFENVKSVYETIADDPNFSTLVSIVERVELTSVFTQNPQLTVFAPTNEAFEKLGQDLTELPDHELKEVILYHVLGQKVTTPEFTQGWEYLPTETFSAPEEYPLSLYVEKEAEQVKLNGTISVITPDIKASNGIIHKVDEVLIPMNLYQLIQVNKQFTEFVKFLNEEPEMMYSLQEAQEELYSLFAPKNDAFEMIQDITAQWTPEDRQQVLSYHMIPGEHYRLSQFQDGQEITTLEGLSFMVSRENDVVTLIDERERVISFEVTDIQATNGVFQIVDKVLLPQL